MSLEISVALEGVGLGVCFDLDSSPPIPPLEGGAVDHRDLELESADGNRFAAFAALPEEPSDVGVVILPDVRGLYRFYEELALRFAERGIAAIAFDYFGRTAGTGRGTRTSNTWSTSRRRRPTTSSPTSAPPWTGYEARAPARSSRSASASAGATRGSRRRAVTGSRARSGSTASPPAASPGPIDRAAEMKAPILALQAGDDQNITAEVNAAFDEALTEAGVEHEVVTYPGAPHSFFDRKQEDFADASEDAWNRTLAFIDRYR